MVLSLYLSTNLYLDAQIGLFESMMAFLHAVRYDGASTTIFQL